MLLLTSHSGILDVPRVIGGVAPDSFKTTYNWKSPPGPSTVMVNVRVVPIWKFVRVATLVFSLVELDVLGSPE